MKIENSVTFVMVLDWSKVKVTYQLRTCYDHTTHEHVITGQMNFSRGTGGIMVQCSDHAFNINIPFITAVCHFIPTR